MKPLYTAYKVLTTGLISIGLPPFLVYSQLKGMEGEEMKERMGLMSPRVFKPPLDYHRLWIHAASLGEVRAARPIITGVRERLPNCAIIISTTTAHGRALAQELFGDIPVIYAPLDHIFMVRKALSSIRPNVMAFLETEIWPAWCIEARRAGAKTALVNGRVSRRSIGAYRRFRAFFKEVLDDIDLFSMILEEDAHRIRTMGAPPQRIEVHGNAKYDIRIGAAEEKEEKALRELLALHGGEDVFLAGSTRAGEEEIILEVFHELRKVFTPLVLIIAPRHIRRVPEIEALLQKEGYAFEKRTQLSGRGVTRRAPIVLLDTFGELFKFYSVATITFCGGSLVPLGGQNPLEAAIWGKPVFYGPSMEDFSHSKKLLEEAGAGFEVQDAKDLTDKAFRFLHNRAALEASGKRAKEAMRRHRGAAARHAEVIVRLLRSG
jgi:3-deoxy-D-manno-octulosonic-acid transferase